MSIDCPICKSTVIYPFLNRKNTPVHQNLLMDSMEEAVAFETADLNMVLCEQCGFVFNTAFDINKLKYGSQYDNRQDCSAQFGSHLNGLLDILLLRENVNNCRIVEIGCGQGDFLKKLVEKGHNNTGLGFDPSYRGSAEQLDGRLRFFRQYYGGDCLELEADVIICRHVIEHVPLPLELLKTIRNTLTSKPNVKVFFETPCVEWIFKNKVIWDFFYEHCSLFTLDSLQTSFELAGFNVLERFHVFQGQYLWLKAEPKNISEHQVIKKTNLKTLAKSYAGSDTVIIERWRKQIMQLAHQGKVAIWGGGAKGTTFLNLIDSNKQFIDCVIDINTNKQGRFIAGTGHPIISHQDLKYRGVKNIILMNPNYLHENNKLLKQAKLTIKLITQETCNEINN